MRTLRRGIGTIFTTGVALVGATLVVANPVSAPQSDVRIPPVKLSADSSASRAALDRALLDAIAQNPAHSGPAELFNRSVAGVVTNVTMLSGRAIEGALRVRPVVHGTPVRVPSPPSSPPKAVADLLSGQPAAVSAANVPAPMVDPALQHAVTSVADYVGYVSVEAVEATDTAGTIAAASPKHIVDTLARLTSGADATITAALRAAAAPLDAPSMVVKAIRTEVRKQLTELADRLRRSLPSPPRLGQVTRPAPVERTTSSLRVRLGHRRGSVVTTTPAASADRTNRTEQADPDLTKPTTVNGATDLSDGNKAVPRAKGPKSPLRQRAEASLNEVRVSLKGLGDALRKAVTPAKPPRLHRSHRH